MTRLLAALAVGLACAAAGAAQVSLKCANDADCASLGESYRCVAEKTGCPQNPSESTCVERVCRQQQPIRSPIKAEHRACARDRDCAIVPLTCQCGYCARPDDEKEGRIAAANKKFARRYAALSKCSRAQTRACAMAGACAMTGRAEPVCRESLCETVYRPTER